MALFKIAKVTSNLLATNRPNTQAGFCYLTTDDMKLYVDLDTQTGSTQSRKPLNALKADALQAFETGSSDANGRWTVQIPGVTELKDGLTIKIRLAKSYNSTYNTLKINNLDAKLVYFSYNNKLTTHVPQWAEILLTYRTVAGSTDQTYDSHNYGRSGWVLDASYNTNDYDRLLNNYERRYAGANAINPYQLCMLDVDGHLQPISIGTSGTEKTANSTPLRYDRIIYYASSGATAANGLVPETILYEDAPITNVTKTFNENIPAYADVYLVGTINQNRCFVLDTSYYKIVVTAANSTIAANTFVRGKYYLYVGATKANNQLQLLPTHQLFYCDDQNGQRLIPANIHSNIDFLPIDSKTYTNVIGTANNNQGAGFFYGKVRANNFNDVWHTKVRVYISAAGQTLAQASTIYDLWGTANTYIAYKCQNAIKHTSYRPAYYNSYFRVSESGYNNDCGGWLGINLIYSWNPTTTVNSRTITVELLEQDNCIVELQDNLIKPDNIPLRSSNTAYYSSTNTSFDNFDFCNNGLRETGDDNDTQTLQSYYTRYKAGTNGLKQYSLAMRDSSGMTWQSFTTDPGTGTAKAINPVGFIPGEIVYLATGSNYTNNQVIGYGVVRHFNSLIDLRYSFNCGTTLTADMPVFLVGTINTTDGLFYLSSPWWAQELPTTEDGKLYVPLGVAYDKYRIDFYGWRDPLIYKDGSIQRYSPSVVQMELANGTLGIEHGGTNATTAAQARTNLGITPANIGAISGVSANGLAPLTLSASQTGTTVSISGQVAAMTAATASAAGKSGIVPAPAAGAQNKFLRGDGTWQVPTDTNTHYTTHLYVNNETTKTSDATGILTNGNVWLHLTDDSTVRKSLNIKGSDAITVKTDNTGAIVINAHDTTYGVKNNGGLELNSFQFGIKSGGVTNDMLAGSIANEKLVNSKITIAGTDVSLGGSITAAVIATVLTNDFAAKSHSHGKITNAGTVSESTTIANGDTLIIADASDTDRIIKSGISFDASTTTAVLTKKGTWLTPTIKIALGSDTASAVNTMQAGLTLGVDGTLPVKHGGSGGTTFTADYVLLGNDTSAFKTIAKTTSNLPNTIVQRDGSGNFSAGTITATLNGTANALTNFVVSTATLKGGKGIRIKYPIHVPVIVSVSRSNGGGRLILMGGGYGAGGITRNDWTEVVSCSSSQYSWSIPNDENIATSIEIFTTNTADASVMVWTSAACTFTEITALTTPAMNRVLLHSSNYTDYTVTKTGSGASGTWGISISGNASTASTATYDSAGNQISNTYIKKSIGTAKGDMIYWTASGTPARLAIGTANYYLKATADGPVWAALPADTKVTQGTSTSGDWRKVLLNGGSGTVYPAWNTAVGNDVSDITYRTVGVSVQPSTNTLKANNIHAARAFNNLITGTGTAAKDNGSSDTSTRYQPAKWTFNTGANATNGDIFTIKIPVAGHDYGVWMSVNNGTNYYPVVVSDNSRLITHYGNGMYITVIFDSAGSAASMYALNGGNSRVTVNNGVFRVVNYYSDGNPGDWNLRQYTIKAQTAITAVHIIGGTDSGYNMIDSGTAFDIRYAVLYAASNINAGSAGTNNYIHHYAINIKNSSGANITLTTYKNVYIKGTISGNLFTPISGGSPYVDTITAADDGYVYYYIGRAYNTNSFTFDATGRDIFIYKNGAIQRWSGYALSAAQAVTDANGNNIVDTYATKSTVNGLLAAADAMIFKGTLGTGGTITGLPNTHEVGWTYKVITAGTYAGQVCEIGDMIVCVADGTAANNAHWTVIQTNTDGAVSGPESSTLNAIARFSNTTGKGIKNSGVTIDDSNNLSTPGNITLTSSSGNSPALIFNRSASGATDWKILVTSGKLSFQSATDNSTYTERAYFKDNSGDFVANSFTGDGANITLQNANRLVWTDSGKKLYAGYHYADASKVAVNYSGAPTENFYVSGTVQFNLGTASTDSNYRRFIVSGANADKMSIAPTGIQVYNTSNNPITMYLQHYGGNMVVGSSSYHTATREMYGMFDFKSANGFTYSGIAAGSDNAARPVWFSYNGINGRPVYDNDFTYNPNTNVLKIGLMTVIGGTSSSNSSSITTTSTLTISAASTIYIDSSANTAHIFRKGPNECARFNTSGMLQLNSTVTQNTHRLLVNGNSAFTGKIAFTDNNNTLTEKAYMIYNDTDKSIDFVFN